MDAPEIPNAESVDIGIDLGTTNSVAAYVDEDGHVQVLKTSAGLNFTPSAVSFVHRQPAVGADAIDYALDEPERTVFSIKRLMGRSIDDEAVLRLQKSYPYIVAADDPDDRGVHIMIDGSKYTPEVISAMILRQIVADASRAIGRDVTHAVITVPAYFSDVQREATFNAGKRVRLTVKKTVDEPTAAALAFGYTDTEDHMIMVFDMGGGTLDVSTGFMADGKFTGFAIEGDPWLGGDDFDQCIVDRVIAHVKRTYRGAVDAIDKDSRFMMAVRRAAEEAKRELTDAPEAMIFIPDIIELPDGQYVEVNYTITREEFEESARGLVDRAMAVVRRGLEKKGTQPEFLTAVLLVGGATKIPMVRQALEDFFGPDKIRDDVDPMEAVAIGAAILSRQLQGIECPKPGCGTMNSYSEKNCRVCGTLLEGILSEVTERDLGISVIDKEKGKDVFSVLIPAHTPYPLEKTAERMYYTNGHLITIPVYVGEAGTPASAPTNDYLGMVQFRLDPDMDVRMRVIVEFDYDFNRILHVHIKDTDGKILYSGTPKRHLPDPNRPAPDTEWRELLKNAISFAETIVDKYEEFIPDDALDAIQKQLVQAHQALNHHDKNEGQILYRTLVQSVEELGVASLLFMADALMYKVDPDTSRWLAETSMELREEYRAGRVQVVTELHHSLMHKVKQIIETEAGKSPITGHISDGGKLVNIPETD